MTGFDAAALTFARWCQATPVAAAIRDSIWLFPFIEGVHLLALALLGGVVLAVDFGLLGIGLITAPADVAAAVRSWLTLALGAILLSGALLFASQAEGYVKNPVFQIKIAALAVAVVFTVAVKPRLLHRGGSGTSRRLIACSSIGLWLIVGLAGRGIGFY